MKRALAVIPARYGSTRFPGKPLVDLLGVPMVVRVARAARKARLVSEVIVATDDGRILDVVEASGIRGVMTPSACASGTDRVASALDRLLLDGAPDLVVNVQGDEPLIDPSDIDVLVESMAGAGSAGAIGTLARRIDSRTRFLDPNIVKVVVGGDARALYFSRAPVPAGADPEAREADARPLQHVGLYAYSRDVLRRFSALPRSPLESIERLEQLRALEYGIPICVAMCVSGRAPVAIDVPEDVEKVLSVLRAEGDGCAAPSPTKQRSLETSGPTYGVH